MIEKVYETKEKLDKLDSIETENTYGPKDTFKNMKWQSKSWEEILANHVSEKEHEFGVCVKTQQLTRQVTHGKNKQRIRYANSQHAHEKMLSLTP